MVAKVDKNWVKMSNSRAVKAQLDNETGDDERPCKILKISTLITNLPGDCLNLIFKFLDTRDDRNSFGLTCHEWLHIQNNNYQSLWYRRVYHHKLPKCSPESFPKVLCQLFNRFQHLKYLSLSPLPYIKDLVTLQPHLSTLPIQKLCLDNCSKYSDADLSLMFSRFPRLTDLSLVGSSITDIGLEALSKCCSSLEAVDLSWCISITDSGISFLVQNCTELRSIDIYLCSNITGIGFYSCPKTLTRVNAGQCKLTQEGIEAIVSGGGLEYLSLTLSVIGEGYMNSEAVRTVSKGCPLLKKLYLMFCKEVDLEGWEAIGRNCKNIELLHLYGCTKICDLGLQALGNGCNKLSSLYLHRVNNCSSYAVDLFESRKPGVLKIYG